MQGIAIIIISFVVAAIGVVRDGTTSETRPGVFGLRYSAIVILLLSVAGMIVGISKEVASGHETREIVSRLEGIDSLLAAVLSGREATDAKTVRRSQAYLAAAGLYSGQLTGKFDEQTRQAVRDFQAALGMPADGIVGPMTMHRITEIQRLILAISSPRS